VYFPPGAIVPEFHVLPVDVCAVLSLLVQVTLPPAAIVTGLGANAVEVSTDAPATIATGVPLLPVDGVVGAVGVLLFAEYEDPQPEQRKSRAAASPKRRNDMCKASGEALRNLLAAWRAADFA
jgi:hypothetical protein